ncbi:potassium-transporting ATPase subunit KdpC [Heliobacterium undosum]|uniref:Potassium-transporting ATPase KdpC subunit n=1 Tax=Heliomicrobium undosum TaxID=121734 RepID=A0A845L8A0_9FIRM|nr:potassium-transporting ATPase subunit KdpC [Heliomicrobium undosum]MZP29948.1 potassium-transporting ATPase subunit KdpC [Heliomicrobium undosum]
MVLLMTLLTGILYPLTVTGLAQALFPAQANGSLIQAGNQVIGSKLIGQNFEGVQYFHPRPSAAGEGYDGAASSGSNLGPTNQSFLNSVQERVSAFRALNGLGPDDPVPSDMVTASASGLDPHITPEAARLQAARVAQSRNMAMDEVTALLEQHIEGRQFGILGEPRVNVLELNIALDELAKR